MGTTLKLREKKSDICLDANPLKSRQLVQVRDKAFIKVVNNIMAKSEISLRFHSLH